MRGIQYSKVKPNRIRKSIGAERTFSEDIHSESFMLEKLNHIADELERRLVKSNSKGKTITIKLKYNDFTQQTRSKTLGNFIQKKEVFFPVIEELLYQNKIEKSVRLLGISVSNLDNEENTEKPMEPMSVQLKFNYD